MTGVGAMLPELAFAPMQAVGDLVLSLLGSGRVAFALALILPLAVALGVAVTGRRPNLRDGITTAGSVATFLAVCGVYSAWVAGDAVGWTAIEMLPGLALTFRVEPLGLIFALVASGLWAPTSLYGFGYMRAHEERNQTRFFVCFALAIFAAVAMAFAGNLVTMFLFYEILTFSTFPLVAHHQTEEAKRAGRVYLGVLVGTSVGLFLLAIVWTAVLAGTTDFRPGGLLAAASVGAGTTLVLLLLFAFGIGKAALMPFHRWLPAAMVAPTPVSALLHAVAVVKAGVFAVLKVVVYVLGIDHLATSLGDLTVLRLPAADLLLGIACFTILSASVVAMRQDNLKRRLAYSTISQLSYIVVAAALFHPMGVAGGGLHIVAHAVGKITLFFCAGAIYVAAHEKDLSRMGGLGRRMPWTYGAFLVASLSIIGLPPLVGAWSKWSLFLAAFATDRWWVAVVLVVASLLALGYLLPVVIDGFFGGRGRTQGRGGSTGEEIHEAPLLCVAPLVWTAALCLLLFFAIDEWQRLAMAVGTGAALPTAELPAVAFPGAELSGAGARAPFEGVIDPPGGAHGH